MIQGLGRAGSGFACFLVSDVEPTACAQERRGESPSGSCMLRDRSSGSGVNN